jgi:hypothetical protein
MEKLPNLVMALGKVSVTTRLTAEHMNMFIDSGV